jgi:N-acetylmuramoyl-L-alanine amidase
MAHARLRSLCIITIVVIASLLPASSVSADAPFNDPFRRTWERVDKPVSELQAARTWLWGPEAFSPGLLENYAEARNGQRVVQYYDKSRMEITSDPTIPPESIWHVTNGLLARELITGQRQTGDNLFEQFGAAEINVAGDGDDPTGPTYATFASLLNAPPVGDGAGITQRVTRLGALPDDPTLARHLVVAAKRVQVDGIDHQIASPFWAFMQSAGMVWVDGGYIIAPLFDSPFYATGYPITEAYWASVRLAGNYTDVLIQCFERRCLTYTPSNAPGWEVESGNIGQHYYAWRYAGTQPTPAPTGHSEVIVLDPGHDRTNGGALGVEYQDVTVTARYTKEALEAAGYTVYLTRPDEDAVLYGDPDLMPANAGSMELGYNQGYAHVTAALRYEPDLVISLHYNGSESSSAAGMTVYYCEQGGEQNQYLAELIRDELREALRSRGYEPPYAYATEDGAIGKNYGHLASLGNVYSAPFAFVENRLAGVPAVLTEPLFETNPTERALIQDDATHRAFAAAYLRAVDRYFGYS